MLLILGVLEIKLIKLKIRRGNLRKRRRNYKIRSKMSEKSFLFIFSLII